MEKAVRRGVFGGRTMLAACLAVSLALPGCAGNGNGDDDMTGALLLGAAVVAAAIPAYHYLRPRPETAALTEEPVP